MALLQIPVTRDPITLVSTHDPSVIEAVRVWAAGCDHGETVEIVAALVDHHGHRGAGLALRKALADGEGPAGAAVDALMKVPIDVAHLGRALNKGRDVRELVVEARAVAVLAAARNGAPLPCATPGDADRWVTRPWGAAHRREVEHLISNAQQGGNPALVHERALFASTRVHPAQGGELAVYEYLDRLPPDMQTEIAWEMYGRLHQVQSDGRADGGRGN